MGARAFIGARCDVGAISPTRSATCRAAGFPRCAQWCCCALHYSLRRAAPASLQYRPRRGCAPQASSRARDHALSQSTFVVATPCPRRAASLRHAICPRRVNLALAVAHVLPPRLSASVGGARVHASAPHTIAIATRTRVRPLIIVVYIALSRARQRTRDGCARARCREWHAEVGSCGHADRFRGAACGSLRVC